MTMMILVSFLFAQITCAMSEADEIFLEAIEHNQIEAISHDTSSEDHNEVTEHQDELSGVSHCVHSHPPLTLLLCDIGLVFEPNEHDYNAALVKLAYSIYHRPPISPPII